MNLYLIKIPALIILITCCIIATYTDIKYGIIPNYLTITTITTGILISTFYYCCTYINLFYYISVIVIFILSYILWTLGLWAGGDVKLFTAISTLLIPEFLEVIPRYTFMGMIYPSDICIINTLTVMLNSVVCIFPIVIIMVFHDIFKNKKYLKNKLFDLFELDSVIFNLNIIIVLNYFIKLFINNQVIIWLIITISAIILNNKIKINRNITITLMIPTVLIVILNNYITSYISSFIIITFIVLFLNMIRKGFISEILTEKCSIENLEEGMILADKLYIKNNKYHFKKTTLKDKIIKKDNSIMPEADTYGITRHDIKTIQKLYKKKKIGPCINIKKTIPFAPFILAGLLITITIGDSLKFIQVIIGVVLNGL